MYKLQHPSKRNKKWHTLYSGLTWFSGSLGALSSCSLCMYMHVLVYEHGSVWTTLSLWRSEDNLGCETPVYLVWDKVFGKLVSQSFSCLPPLAVRPLGLSELWGSKCRSSCLCDRYLIPLVSFWLLCVFITYFTSITEVKHILIREIYLTRIWTSRLQRLDFRCLCCLLHFYCLVQCLA